MSTYEDGLAVAARCWDGDAVDLNDVAPNDPGAQRALHDELQRVGRSLGLVCDGHGVWRQAVGGTPNLDQPPCPRDSVYCWPASRLGQVPAIT